MTALAPFEQSVDYSTPTKRRRNSATKRRSRGSSAYDGSPARGSIAALASTTNDASDSYQTLDRIERYDAEKAADEILTQVTAAIRDENLEEFDGTLSHYSTDCGGSHEVLCECCTACYFQSEPSAFPSLFTT